jgi:HEAT repeat protein
MSSKSVPSNEELAQRARRLSLGRSTPKAGRALGELGARALPELQKALAHPNPFVRSGAVHGLGAVQPSSEAIVRLIEGALRNDADPRVRETACFVLGQLGSDAVRVARDALDAASKDSDDRVRAAAAKALDQ